MSVLRIASTKRVIDTWEEVSGFRFQVSGIEGFGFVEPAA
jgi:hypothetical protein